MKGRFPPDLFVVVLGPILIALIVIGLGSVIFHAEQLRGSVASYRHRHRSHCPRSRHRILSPSSSLLSHEHLQKFTFRAFHKGAQFI